MSDIITRIQVELESFVRDGRRSYYRLFLFTFFTLLLFVMRQKSEAFLSSSEQDRCAGSCCIKSCLSDPCPASYHLTPDCRLVTCGKHWGRANIRRKGWTGRGIQGGKLRPGHSTIYKSKILQQNQFIPTRLQQILNMPTRVKKIHANF